jgi:Na+/melibiose symporter-like transporter
MRKEGILMKTEKESKKRTKEQRLIEKAERAKKYNLATTWQLVLFPANTAAGVLFMMLMMSVSYFAAGVVGLGTVIASVLITGSRIFDAITDPILGFILDRLNGRFGKVRPFLIIGYLLMSASTLTMFFTAHHVPEGIRLIYFILLYVIYTLGYAFVSVGGSSAGPIITNDPKQRPLLGGLGTIYATLFGVIIGMLTPLYLVPKYGGYNSAGLFQEFVIIVVIAAGVLYAISIAAIWKKDQIENFGVGDSKHQSIKLKDVWPILKGNRPLQMFALSAVADKLAITISTNAVIGIMLYGIILGDYSLSGFVLPFSMIFNIIGVIIAVRYAGKVGLKKAFVTAAWGCIIINASLFTLLLLGNPTQIGLDNIGFMTIGFFSLVLLAAGFSTMANATCGPMLPDIVDYQTYKTGQFVPGTLATLYAFIDKGISSISPMIVGLAVAVIGFKDAFPDVDTPYSNSIFWTTLFLAYFTITVGYSISVIAMKFYPLTKEKMEEIQTELKARRDNLETGEQQKILP